MGNVYAVADLHGVYGLWVQIRNYLQRDNTLFILGDCADREEHGWQIIKEALTDPRVFYIRGNHDQFILDSWRNDWMDNWLWFNNGGYTTYEAILNDHNHEKYLIELSKTKFYHCYVNKEGQRIHLSHAGFTLMEDDVIPHKSDLLWDREHIDDHCDWWPEQNPTDYVVHGHTWCASSVFKRSAYAFNDVEINDTQTVSRYAHGHKICIDGRSFIYNRCALLDLDTLQETVISVETLN